jgi:hypothetical protein
MTARAHTGDDDVTAPALAARGFTPHDGHPFARADGAEACAFCGEHSAHILHHPTRIRAACALLCIDPAPLLPRR